MKPATKSQILTAFDDHREKLSLFNLSQMMQMFLGRFYFEPIAEDVASDFRKTSNYSSEAVKTSAP